MIQLRTVDEVDLQGAAREPGVHDREPIGLLPHVEIEVLQKVDRAVVEGSAIDRGIERKEETHIVAGQAQVLGQRRREIAEAPDLREWRGLGRDQTDSQAIRDQELASWMLRSNAMLLR